LIWRSASMRSGGCMAGSWSLMTARLWGVFAAVCRLALGRKHRIGGCEVGDLAHTRLRCYLLRPDLLIHLFQQVLAHHLLKLLFVHKLSRDLLVLVHPVDKEPFESL